MTSFSHASAFTLSICFRILEHYLVNSAAFGSLSNLIIYLAGKRPRDLLNPKAIKYMQAVFSLKDAISKKESREISAQFGVTVTQVCFPFACICKHQLPIPFRLLLLLYG